MLLRHPHLGYHREINFGRDLMRLLAQPWAHSRARSDVKSGCLRLAMSHHAMKTSKDGAWRLLSMQCILLLYCLHGESAFPYLFSYLFRPLPLVFQPMCCCEGPGSSLFHSVGTLGAAGQAAEITYSPCGTSRAPSDILHGAKWACSRTLTSFPCCGAQNCTHYSKSLICF